MNSLRSRGMLAGVIAGFVGMLCAGRAMAQMAPRVQTLHMPDGSIQPQVAVDSRGTLHLLYYRGDAGHGDVFYVRSSDGGATFSAPIRVNSQPESAIAAGNMRGAQIAIGRNGIVHVCWNGATKALPKGPLNPGMPADSVYNGTPMLYSRLNNAGTAFEPQRNLMRFSYGLDGGGSVAADPAGHVFVVWHAAANGSRGPSGRSVFVARSEDDGMTFAREAPAWSEPTGCCECCAVKAFVDSQGLLRILYRTAKANVDRDIYLLSSSDAGTTFTGGLVHPWNINVCPMSTEAYADGAAGLYVGWETEWQVYFGPVDRGTGKVTRIVPAPGTGAPKRQHPALAVNPQGQVLMAWTVGMGWNQGGSVAWQVFDPNGQPVAGTRGRADGVPAWSLVAAFPRPDGSFVVVY